MRAFLYGGLAVLSAVSAWAANPEDDSVGKRLVSPVWDRFNEVVPGLVPLGRFRVRTAEEIGASNWSIGCETLDRDYADFELYKRYLPKLGAKHARFFSGWAKTEKQKGVYDFAWLDVHVRETAAMGIKPWLCLGYGNPLYGCDFRLGMRVKEVTDDPVAFAAWIAYAEACVRRYRDVVDTWEIWNEPFAQGEAYSRMFYETARRIKAIQPEAKVLVAAGRFPDDYRAVLEKLRKENALDLADLWSYHPYDMIPDRSYDEMAEPLERLIRSYSPKYRICQGEVGCPAQLEYAHALPNHPWTEQSQTKWNLRRWAGDAVRGIPSNHFTVIDLQYTFMLQSFGLLRANARHQVQYPRPSWYAAQNMFSFFDASVAPKGLRKVRCNGHELSVAAFEKAGRSVFLLWYSDGVPSDGYAYDRVDLVDMLPRFEKPVFMDLVTGKVYQLETLSSVPVRDCPVLVAEAASVETVPFAPLDPAALDRYASSPLEVRYGCVGRLSPRSAREISGSSWTLGCETLDRDFADFSRYRDYLSPLGVKRIRLQAGWAKCEKEPGKYDFAWLDEIVNFAQTHGMTVLLETDYGNPAYPGAGGWDLGAGFPTSAEGLAAWDRWVEALSRHFAGRVRDWAMWNEPDLRGPDGKSSKTPQEIAAFNVRTARIIRRNVPEARIGALSLAMSDPKAVDDCLAAMERDVDLFDWVIYHGYEFAPERSYADVEKLKKVLAKYSPKLRLFQGENGCPSELTTRFALPGVAWTEVAQAKWDLRRLLGDLGHDVLSSVFTACDFNHKGLEINRKGLIRTDGDRVPVAYKRAYLAVRNVAAVFDDALVRVPEKCVSVDDRALQLFEYRTCAGRPLYAFWTAGEEPDFVRPTDGFRPRPLTFVATSAPLSDPVWIDLLTGRVYAVPKSDVRVRDGRTEYADVPVYDSPCVLCDRADVRMK